MKHERNESISRQAVNWLSFLLIAALFAVTAARPEFIGSTVGKIIHAYKTEMLNK